MFDSANVSRESRNASGSDNAPKVMNVR